MTNPTISIDVGFGSTKFCYRDQTGKLTTAAFPTLAPVADRVDLSLEGADSDEICRLTIEGIPRLFGPDVTRFCDPAEQSIQEPGFARHPLHAGFVLAALWRSGHTQVKNLMLGLPVDRMALDRDFLIQRYQGRHQLDHRREVCIESVHVVAQPVGGLLCMAAQTDQLEQLRTSINLIVDPGHGTTDWVVAEGLRPNAKRGGTHAIGMRRIQETIAAAIQVDRGVECPVTPRFVERFQHGVCSLRGQTVPLEPYVDAARPLIEQTIHRLMGAIGTDADIDRLFVSGGGSAYFAQTLKAKFPGRPVHLSKYGICSNVRGFQLAGEMLAHQKAEVNI